MRTKFYLSLRGKTAIVITLGLALIAFLWAPHFLEEKAASLESESVAEIPGKRYNRLASEKSPYLLQHADNPINWYPWGEEAFAAARAENKPIFLSIGYSTCHWCHVLESESFEDDEVAAVLNQGYICIKVDREEHPDVDQMYMDVVQAMTGRGGWPMTVVMSPDMMPFFGGTYFPKEDLLQILRALDDTWRNEPEKIAAIGKQVHQFLESRSVISTSTVTLDDAVLKNAYYKIRSQADPVFGGFGTAPKFPPTTRLEILNRITHRTGEKNALEMVSSTLEHMARGGMYDHLGGGFHRYSTDEEWLVPHFEKMLYDQAALSWAYLEGFQVTQNPMFEWVARGVLDYVLRDMTGPHGGFYSAEDADSEGEEGTFYLWSDQELREILTEKQYQRFAETYGVSAEGNFELLQQPTNILHLPRHVPWKVKFDPDLVSIHEKLLRHRAKRVHPFKDDKIITAWNGLMLGSMAKAYQVLGDEKYLKAAQNAARFIKANLYRDGKLLRRYRLGEAGHPGTLDDYAYLVHGLLTLYEADFDETWFQWARQLQLKQDELLWDTEAWGYFFAELNANLLPMRKKEFADNARPNSNAVAVLNLLKFYNFTLENEYKNKAEQILKGTGEHLLRFPQGFSRMLVALDFYLDRAKQIAVVGPAESREKDTIIRALQTRFLPNKILAFTPPTSNPPLPVLKDKITAEGKTTVYVCEENVCKYPTGDLKKVLEMADDPKRYQL